MDLVTRTTVALGRSVLETLQAKRFCIVGCSGTGANFAEMLVRSGAKKLVLIDGGKVKASDLNRVFAFDQDDVKQQRFKAKALKARLMKIIDNDSEIEIECVCQHVIKNEQIVEETESPEEEDRKIALRRAREAVFQDATDVVFIAVDKNDDRREIEKLCRNKQAGQTGPMYLSCGIYIDRDRDEIEFECNWQPKTPDEDPEMKAGPAGAYYGPENASYCAIVAEAVSIAFSMLLNRLAEPKKRKGLVKSYRKSYHADWTPNELNVVVE